MRTFFDVHTYIKFSYLVHQPAQQVEPKSIQRKKTPNNMKLDYLQWRFETPLYQGPQNRKTPFRFPSTSQSYIKAIFSSKNQSTVKPINSEVQPKPLKSHFMKQNSCTLRRHTLKVHSHFFQSNILLVLDRLSSFN